VSAVLAIARAAQAPDRRGERGQELQKRAEISVMCRARFGADRAADAAAAMDL
jgi:hypothetical protein